MKFNLYKKQLGDYNILKGADMIRVGDMVRVIRNRAGAHDPDNRDIALSSGRMIRVMALRWYKDIPICMYRADDQMCSVSSSPNGPSSAYPNAQFLYLDDVEKNCKKFISQDALESVLSVNPYSFIRSRNL